MYIDECVTKYINTEELEIHPFILDIFQRKYCLRPDRSQQNAQWIYSSTLRGLWGCI
jgi:hypothetical protein